MEKSLSLQSLRINFNVYLQFTRVLGKAPILLVMKRREQSKYAVYIYLVYVLMDIHI